jgi:DnaJ domain
LRYYCGLCKEPRSAYFDSRPVLKGTRPVRTRRFPIQQFFLSLLALAAILYLLGWLPKANASKLAAWVRGSSGILFVSGAVFILTRNIVLAMLGGVAAYFLLQKETWLPDGGRRTGGMGVQEAYDYLGLKPGATRDEIQAAHRDLMKRTHPDQGDPRSTYIAAKVNEAKDVLLKHVQA